MSHVPNKIRLKDLEQKLSYQKENVGLGKREIRLGLTQTTTSIKQIINEDPLDTTVNSTAQSVKTYGGIESEESKWYRCMYECINHYRTQTQNCIYCTREIKII